MIARCLQVATNYVGTSAELRGCLNDLDNVRRNILPLLNVFSGNLIQLINEKYTAKACRKYLEWGLNETKEGDIFIFNHSGHGTTIIDRNNDESDGYDEGICPNDILADINKNLITDDELHIWLKKFPKNCLVILLIDACHSGTMTRSFDILPKRIINPSLIYQNLGEKITSVVSDEIQANVVLFPGCKEDQTSADAYIGGKFQGAMTYFFIEVLKSYNGNITNKKLVEETARLLKKNKFTQEPELFCTNNIEEKLFGKL